MNERYKNLILKDGVYAPNMGIDYPENNPYERLYHPIYDRNVVVDASYPYLDDSRSFRWKNYISYIFILYLGLGLLLTFKMGLKVKGRNVLRKYKKELSHGAITIGNHCFRLDAPSILLAVKARHTTRIPMFAPNFSTNDNFLLRVVGGIPIPNGMDALKKFNAAFDEFHRRGYWFHIFPEAARWDFYKPIRSFQKGAFTMSYKYNMPLVPCVITYRERKGIYRLFGPKSLPLLTVNIGEPIFPDTNQPRKEEVEHLLVIAHQQMCELAGIINNTWPAQQDNV